MPAAPRPPARLQAHHKVWLDLGPRFLVGPNYVTFLKAIDETGTIRGAGRVVGWSYRTCQNRLTRLARVLGAPPVDTERGGASGGHARLTPAVRELVRRYERWDAMSRAASERAFRRVFGAAR
jgi:molybdate transport system regulatory protein